MIDHTLPRGGFGNLIALRLQKQAREAGNSVFVIDALEPHSDQWALLASIERMPRERVDEIVASASEKGRIIAIRAAGSEEDAEPWSMLPSRRRNEPKIRGEPFEGFNTFEHDAVAEMHLTEHRQLVQRGEQRSARQDEAEFFDFRNGALFM